MTKHLRRVSLLLLSVVICCGAILACSDGEDWSQYAAFYDRVEEYTYEEYKQENMTRAPVFGINLDYSVLPDSHLPDEVVNIIRTQSEFERAIQDGHIEIDFDKEVLVLYWFTDIYYGSGCKLQSVKIDGDTLKIDILHEMAKKEWWESHRPPSTSMPIQRCLAVKTTLTDFDNANVKLNYED